MDTHQVKVFVAERHLEAVKIITQKSNNNNDEKATFYYQGYIEALTEVMMFIQQNEKR